MQPRPYQVDALNVLWSALKHEKNVLLEAGCSAGKTLMFSKIARRRLKEVPLSRVLILMDREVLVKQTLEKLLEIAPELTLDIGIVCDSVSKTKETHKRVTIASRQTLAKGKMLGEFQAPDLLIIDEAHLMSIPKRGKEPKDQYGIIIKTLREYNPNMRLLGVTASPYRLVDGYIYGDKNYDECQPYFKELHHKITNAELLEQGFVAPLKGKVAVIKGMSEQLKNIRMVGGEYNIGDLSNIMADGTHVSSAVETWKEYASDRKKTIAFCVDIKHVEMLVEAFNSEGIKALPIHSKLSPLENHTHMTALKEGTAKVFCSVAKLTTGMDIVDIDCIVQARPTKSTALYKQMLGRGQRIAEDKIDCLVLDLVGNSDEHGTDLDKLKVKYKKSKSQKAAEMMTKECPECEAELHIAVRLCECGYAYPESDFIEADNPEMKDLEFGGKPPVDMIVEDIYPRVHLSRKSGKELLEVKMSVLEGNIPISASLWLCYYGDGYGDYEVGEGRTLWKHLTVGNENYPENAQEAYDRKEELIAPDIATIDFSGEYAQVKGFRYTSSLEEVETLRNPKETTEPEGAPF